MNQIELKEFLIYTSFIPGTVYCMKGPKQKGVNLRNRNYLDFFSV